MLKRGKRRKRGQQTWVMNPFIRKRASIMSSVPFKWACILGGKKESAVWEGGVST